MTWTVNGIIGGDSTNGTISPAGLYTPPAVLPANTTLTIRAMAVAAPSVYMQSGVSLGAKLPAQVSLADARFLDQATFGPSPASLQHLAQIGQAAWFDEQFQMPATQIPVPADNSMGALRQWSLYNYSAAPDQLRQKVAFALGQIIVTSANKLIYADEILPWMNSLSTHAFGNYRTLLREIATGPSMGKYLDLANSVKPNGGSGANENFAREVSKARSNHVQRTSSQRRCGSMPCIIAMIATRDDRRVFSFTTTRGGWPAAPDGIDRSRYVMRIERSGSGARARSACGRMTDGASRSVHLTRATSTVSARRW